MPYPRIIYIWLNFQNAEYINHVRSPLPVSVRSCMHGLMSPSVFFALINRSQVHK